MVGLGVLIMIAVFFAYIDLTDYMCGYVRNGKDPIKLGFWRAVSWTALLIFAEFGVAYVIQLIADIV